MDDLVEYGLGSFTGNAKEVTVAEPLVLMGIFHYFTKSNLPLDADIRDRLPVNRGEAFEETLLLSYTSLFRSGARLDEIFDFHDETLDWARQKAFIVARDSRGAFHRFDIITSDPIVPSTGVSSVATEPADVEAWMRNVPTGWCLPGNRMGPDLMAWLQLADGKMLLLLIQAKCYLSGNKDRTLKAGVVADAIRSLTPKCFYSSVVGILRRSPLTVLKDFCIQPSKQAATESMLSSINQEPCFTGAEYNVLRVIAAFPQVAEFSKRSPKVAAALQNDQHPIATIKEGLLMESLAREPKVAEILSTLTTMHKRARDGTDDEMKASKRKK